VLSQIFAGVDEGLEQENVTFYHKEVHRLIRGALGNILVIGGEKAMQ